MKPSTLKVFIENEANSSKKNLYNEKTLEYIKTIKVARAYPFPYGFVLDTTAEDGDNVDVFVLTEKKLKSGQIVNCQPTGLMEQFELAWDKSKVGKEEKDHNVLAVLIEDSPKGISTATKAILKDFVTHVFDNMVKNKTRVGRFLGKKAAIQYIADHLDKKE